tara:strand:- start:97 stop:210 length:114 start_codon:yes stop_codon:yes gene_type:complete
MVVQVHQMEDQLVVVELAQRVLVDQDHIQEMVETVVL